jgi:2-succinyl-6-hydroxy-2,4-cyclohexadiene-1-carboxylate synthase
VLVNGVNLNVAAAGSGPPVVALHGFSSNMSTWAQFVREAGRRYTVITIDLLGHGGSDAPNVPERYRMEHTVNDVAQAIHDLGFPQACWLGYSMGARTALAAAALLPMACRSLIIEGGSPGLESPSARTQRRRQDEDLADFILKEGIEAFTDYWEQRPLFDTQKSLPSKIRRRIKDQRLKSSPIGLANTLRAAGPGAQPSLYKLLPGIKIPVLCVVGECDLEFITIARKICSKLQNGRLGIIPGAGHAPHVEKPHEFNRVVLTFLDESRG